MHSRDRIKTIFAHMIPDRIGMLDAYWVETIERWLNEGLAKDRDIQDIFNHDISFVWFEARLGLKEEILYEDSEYKHIKNIDGISFKIPKKKIPYIKDDVDLPGFPIDYTVKEKSDWEKYKHLYYPSEWRMAYRPEITPPYHGTKENIEQLWKYYKELNQKNRFIFFSTREPFEATRNFLGTENFLTQIALDKAWIKEMFMVQTDLIIGMYELFLEKDFKFDGLWVWGDICFNKGMIISPDTYRELLFPEHKRLFRYFREKDMPVVYHTDGYIDEALPLLLKAGITGIQPLEAKAGNDIFSIKKKYGKELTLIGNIDSRLMSGKKFDMESEVKKKIGFAKQGGGYIYHSDHSIPVDVSMENYCFLMDCVKKYGIY
jgi:uroporphyrinogen decarboxylase